MRVAKITVVLVVALVLSLAMATKQMSAVPAEVTSDFIVEFPLPVVDGQPR